MNRNYIRSWLLLLNICSVFHSFAKKRIKSLWVFLSCVSLLSRTKWKQKKKTIFCTSPLNEWMWCWEMACALCHIEGFAYNYRAQRCNKSIRMIADAKGNKTPDATTFIRNTNNFYSEHFFYILSPKWCTGHFLLFWFAISCSGDPFVLARRSYRPRVFFFVCSAHVTKYNRPGRKWSNRQTMSFELKSQWVVEWS